jgi:hypothetical protein
LPRVLPWAFAPKTADLASIAGPTSRSQETFDCNDGTDAFATADPHLADADIGVRGATDDFSQQE